MAKQINVDLRVNADIKQAKANFESLQKTLFKLQESTRIDVKDESLAKAQRAAGDLARNLQQATNVNTGKLDLNKFSSSLNKSGQDLKKLHQQLSSLGPEGEQAFFKLTQSIATADASTLNLGKKLSSLGVVLKNTARWQLSSSLLHGFMGAISGAYRYAQDLNESLNNIRIVTGQNIDQMSQFAKEANNAAKALSTTTTQYTDASLIYYQQGLSDEDVKRRTDATIKLANVSRQSAEEVSSQMTAIWNNFAKGNENLEYYEDVITKLGATTASSSSEIANGLSKFAAVADTVGLSYEKASAALATVVAETRQSEDIVGTAFKTMFARLEGLNLGETLEDGVDLNKYSKALEAVGVSILDNNGKIKSMNDILDETGAKWQNIGKEQQIALAQTVAGVRQYTQFIALMDNYDKVLKNEAVAKGSAGTVDEQAKVYAESWEAARDRVTAALETIYQQLLRDDFFIDMLNGAEKFLGVISNVIDGLGGVKGILLLISSIFMQYYAKEMPRVLQSLRDNISVITGTSERGAQALLAKAREELEAMESRNRQMSAVATTTEVTTKMTEALNKARKGLSQTEIEAYEYEIKLAGAIGKTTEELGKEIDLLEKKGRTKANGMARDLSRREGPASDDARTIALNNMKEEMDSVDVDQLKGKKQQLEEEKNKIQDDITEHENNIVKIRNSNKKNKNKNNRIKKEQTIIDNKQESLKETEEELDNIDKLLGGNEAKTKQHHEELKKYYDTFNQYLNKTSKQLFTDLEKAEKRYGKNSVIIEEAQNKIDGLNKKLAKNNLPGAIKEAQKYVDKLKTIELPDNISDTLKKELIDGLNDGLEELKSGKGTNKLKEAFENFNQVLESSDMEIEAIQQHLQILGASDEDLKELSRIWEEAGKGSEEFKAKVEEIKNKIEELPQHTVKISEGLTQMASAAMQVSMIINGFQNIGRIFSDEDLSAGEKIIQTMTAVGSMLPMIIALINKQRIVEMGAVAAKILHIGATEADAAAETASIGAKIASGTAGWYALGSLLLFVVIAAAVVAAIVLITNALMAAANAESEEEKAVRLANEELERSKKAAEEAKQAYEDLKSAVSNYDSAIEALEKCTKGTQEWRDAFREVLHQANEIIQKYPQLLSYEKIFNSDGTLNTEVLNQAVKDAEKTSIAMENLVLEKQNDLTLAEYNLNKKKTIASAAGDAGKKSSNYKDSVGTKTVTRGQGRDSYTVTESVSMEELTKAAVSAIGDKIGSNYDNKAAVKELVQSYLEDQNTYKIKDDKLNDATNTITDSIMSVSNNFEGLSQETEKTMDTMNNASKMLLQNLFGEDLTPEKELAYEEAKAEKEEELKERYQKAYLYTANLENGSNDDIDTMRNSSEKKLNNGDVVSGELAAEMLDIYVNKIHAGEYGEVQKDDAYYQKDGIVYTNLTDAKTGQRLEDKDQIKMSEVKEEVIAYMLAQSTSEMKNRAEEIAKSDSYQQTNSAMMRYMNDFNFNNATIGDMKKLQSSGTNLSSAFGDENGNIDDDKIKDFLARKLNKDKKEISDDMVNQFKDGFDSGLKESLESVDKIPKVIQERMGEGLLNSLTADEATKVGKVYAKAMARQGEEGANLLNSITKSAGDEAGKVMSALSDMDLSDIGVKEANEALKKLGIQFELSESQFYSFKNVLKDVSTVTAETAQETYKNISSILSKIKSIGDVIEEEDYQKLLAVNPAISEYFTAMADGTHMLTGAAQDFKTAVQSATINELYNAQKNDEDTAIAYGELSSGYVKRSEMNDETYYVPGVKEAQYRDTQLWNKYQDQTLAQIKVLRDNGQSELADNLEAQIQAGENLQQVVLDAAEAYDALNLSAEDYTTKAEEASQEAAELAETIKEAKYQNEISNAGLEYEETENYANVLMELYEAQGLTKDSARALSIANQKLDRGLSSLNDNFEDWSKSLKNTSKASAEYAETVTEIREAFADLLNIADGNELSLEWLEKWMNDSSEMEKILDGDTEAIQRFRESAFTEMTTNVFSDMKDSISEMIKELDSVKDKDYISALQAISDTLASGAFEADNLRAAIVDLSGQEIGGGATLSQEYVDSLNEMLKQGLLTEQQLNDIFATIGYKPKVTTKNVLQWVDIPQYETVEDITETKKPDGKGIIRTTKSYTRQIDVKHMQQNVPVAQIESADEATGNIEIVNAGSANIIPSYSSTSSGKASDDSSSSSSNPTTKAASHDHEVNRYSNEENAIKGLSEQYDRLNKAKDKAFGKGRIDIMEKELKQLKELKKASGDYLDAIVGNGNASKVAQAIYQGQNIGSMIANGQIEGTARADYNSLFGGLSASGKGLEYTAKDSAGNEWLVSDNYSLSGFNSLFGTNLSFSLDQYGNLQNKDAMLNLLQNLKNNEENAYSSYANPTADSTTEYNKRMAYLKEIKERIEQYGSTVELLGEKANEYLDYISGIQEKNAEIITGKMENGVNLGKKSHQRIERAMKILGDKIYKTAEGMSQWFNNTFNKRLEANKQQADGYDQALKETKEKINLYTKENGEFDENAIDPASAAELLESIESGYDSLIDDTLNTMEEMKNFWGNALKYWDERLNTVNKSIQDNIKILQHFETVLNLLGRSADYKALNSILNGQLKTADSYYVATKAEANASEVAYQSALKGKEELESNVKNGTSSQDALDAYLENVYYPALNKYQERVNEMYSALEDVLKLTNTIYENEVNRIFQEFEDYSTGTWGSFNALDSAMKRQQSVAEEYLTKTNQLYETNTMLRKLSQDIDKTDSRVAKEKLKAFSDEITSMKSLEKLTKADLEIAKARYEVLKAQIALEEAQNAKSTVRLQRDNEGNYGYVYTADQDKINDAEQTLEDKQNTLYNIGIKNAETYGQKLIQIRKEWSEEIKKLDEDRKNGLISSDQEYYQQLNDINQKYQELELTYLHNYTNANLVINETGAEGQTEAWTSSFDDIITKQTIFSNDSQNEGERLVNELDKQMNWLNEKRNYYSEDAKIGNKELQQSIDEITDSSEELSKEITKSGGLADSMQNVMVKAAENLTTAFSNQYDELSELIEQYRKAADEANTLYKETANLINAQVAYNIAKNGATSVSWNTDGTPGAYNTSTDNDGNNSSDYNATTQPSVGGTGQNEPVRMISCTPIDSTYHLVKWSNNTTSKKSHAMRNRKCVDCGYEKKWTKIGDSGKGTIQIKSSSGEIKWINEWEKFKYGLKSGGYTGIWDGPDIEENGKLAFLHQKELVLNADDTENMLSAVKLIRQISQTIDLQAAAYNATASGFSVSQLANSDQTLQQEVTIHAEFPNVSDHNEIEEAFNNLINKATQYVNRY